MRLGEQFEQLWQWDGRRRIRASVVPQHDLGIAEKLLVLLRLLRELCKPLFQRRGGEAHKTARGHRNYKPYGVLVLVRRGVAFPEREQLFYVKSCQTLAVAALHP